MISPTLTTNGTPTAARPGKYLTFALGKEEYGLEILKVREIIGMMEITAIPRAPAYVKGVINLRGQVIAVIDLRSRFRMETVARTEDTCVIVVEIKGRGVRTIHSGIIVDRVSEVLQINSENIDAPPSFGGGVETEFILGMAKIGKSVKILIDIDHVLTFQETAELAALSAA